MQLSKEFLEEKLWSRVRNPIWYVGGEFNIPEKEFTSSEVRIVLSFPDLYEVGMSNLGWQILYHIVNSDPRFSAERVFAVPPDVERLLKWEKIPLYSLETRTPINEFDTIGFSLSHELLFTTMLQVLELGGIPLRARDRNSFPLIIAGGPGVANPEPIASFVDVVFIGEAEEAIIEILEVIAEGKKVKAAKSEILERLRKIEGVYIPAFFDPIYQDGRLTGYRSKYEDYTRVRKRLIVNLNNVPFPAKQLVPLTQVVHDRFTVEIARGCVRSCRFCQAGMIYRPVRERDINKVLDIVRKGIAATGMGDLSLLSLSAGDYTQVEDLVKEIMDWAVEEKISLSFPSMRIDTLSQSIIEQVRRVRKTGFTIAPETGSDRLRRVINKYWTNEDVLKTARIVAQAGWRLIKLYFMIGLPMENEEDRNAIVDLVREVKKIIGNVNASIALFVPKPHTPFQWEHFAGVDWGYKTLMELKKKIKKLGAGFRWHSPEMSYLEAVLGRGDRRVADVIEDVFERGGRLDSWNEYFNFELWMESFKKLKIDPAIFAGEIPEDAYLPWDHIDYLVVKKFLKREREKARKEIETPFCLDGPCTACGACDFKKVKNVTSSQKEFSLKKHKSPEKFRKVAVNYSRRGIYKYMSSRDYSRNWGIFFRRAGIDIKYSEGFHPLPAISFIFPAPVGVESADEWLEVWVDASLSNKDIEKKLEKSLPQEFAPIRVIEIGNVNLSSAVRGFIFYAYSNVDLVNNIDSFIRSKEIIWKKKTRKGKTKVKHMKEYVEILNYDKNSLVFKFALKEDGMIPVSVFLEIGLGISDPFSKLHVVRKHMIFGEEVFKS